MIQCPCSIGAVIAFGALIGKGERPFIRFPRRELCKAFIPYQHFGQRIEGGYAQRGVAQAGAAGSTRLMHCGAKNLLKQRFVHMPGGKGFDQKIRFCFSFPGIKGIIAIGRNALIRVGKGGYTMQRVPPIAKHSCVYAGLLDDHGYIPVEGIHNFQLGLIQPYICHKSSVERHADTLQRDLYDIPVVLVVKYALIGKRCVFGPTGLPDQADRHSRYA